MSLPVSWTEATIDKIVSLNTRITTAENAPTPPRNTPMLWSVSRPMARMIPRIQAMIIATWR